MNQLATDNNDVLERFQAELERRNISQAQAAQESGVSPTTLTQLLNGKYGADPRHQYKKLEKWLASASAAQTLPIVPIAPDFVETPTANRVLAALGAAQINGDISVIYGGAGLGKTTASQFYSRNYSNVFVVTMSPATASVSACLEEVCYALGFKSPPGRASRMQREIIRRIMGSKGLLIVDEAQHLSVSALDALRALHDATGIGIALVGNEAIYTAMTGGTRAAYLDRLFSRIGKRAHLSRATKADIRNLAAAMGVNTSDTKILALLEDIGKRAGALRSVVKTIRQAALMANGSSPEFKHLEASWKDLNV